MKMKKMLSSVIAAAMVMSTMSINVFAEEYPTENWIDSADTSWYENGAPYVINDADDLAGLAKLVNEKTAFASKDFCDDTVTLGADIDLEGKLWTPIGQRGGARGKDYGSFLGIFDGGEYTISNVTVVDSNDIGLYYANIGLFGSAGLYDESTKTVIKNFTVDNATVISTIKNDHKGSCVAAVIGNSNANIDVQNIYLTGNVTVEGYAYVGGIVGHGYPAMDNCHVNATGTVKSNMWCCGGLIGYLGEGADVTNCSVKGLDLWSAMAGIGGAVGRTNGGSTLNNIDVSNTTIDTTPGYKGYGVGYVASGADTATNSSVSGVSTTLNGEAYTPDDAGAVSVNVAIVDGEGFATLADAIAYAETLTGDVTIELVDDVTEDVTIQQKAGLYLTISGVNDAVFNGTMTIDGKSSSTTDRSLVIENIAFEADGISGDANIFVPGGGQRYTYNVTVQNCSFTDSGATTQDIPAIKQSTGGCKNWEIIGCTVDNTMHSLLQVHNVDNIVIDGCTVESKNGINLANSANAEVKNSTVDVSGYAVRIGDGSNPSISPKVTITNNNLKTSSTAAEDAAIVIRKGASMATVNIEENNIVGEYSIANDPDKAVTDFSALNITADKNYWGGSVANVEGFEIAFESYYVDEDRTTLKSFPEGEFNSGIVGVGVDSKNREKFFVELQNVKSYESLVMKTYSDDVLIATTTLRDYDRDDENAALYPRIGTTTVNVTLPNYTAGSWDTQWHYAPDEDLVPNKVELWVDGVLKDTKEGITDADAEAYKNLVSVAKFANEIKLSYEKVNDKEYKIYVESVDGKNINRLSAVEGKFDFIDLKGKATYELTAADGVTLVSDRDDENVYEFNFNPDATGTKLEIGKVTFTATEAEFGFGLVAYDETTANTATLLNNIVYSYVPDGDMKVDGKFNVTDSVIDGGVKIEEETTEVKVVIDFNNKITAGNEADYNDMKVTLTGSNGDVYEGYVGSAPATDVADDNVFYFENTAEKVEMTFNVKSGYRYTAVVKGEGYRTARYTTVVDDATTLKFWNNAMADENNNPVLVPIEEYFESSKRDITFLAGDIALDNVIDKYDLAAVVSYFGYDENTEKVDMADYVKYDLNRDGRIDADDISYVLVSWGK